MADDMIFNEKQNEGMNELLRVMFTCMRAYCVKDNTEETRAEIIKSAGLAMLHLNHDYDPEIEKNPEIVRECGEVFIRLFTNENIDAIIGNAKEMFGI